jgi:hypothetical protein
MFSHYWDKQVTFVNYTYSLLDGMFLYDLKKEQFHETQYLQKKM